MIRLTHPEHGIHIAYNDLEIKKCKKNGWTELKPPRKKRGPNKPKVALNVDNKQQSNKQSSN